MLRVSKSLIEVLWKPIAATLLLPILVGFNPEGSGNAGSTTHLKTSHHHLPALHEVINRDSVTFSATGLYNEKIIMDFFSGNFLDIPFDRDAAIFYSLYEAYLNAFAESCGTFLPANKVEMTTERCASETLIKNDYGEVMRRECEYYEAVGTGLYADSAMYEGLLALKNIQNADAVRNIFGMFTGDQTLSRTANMIGMVRAVIHDMGTLVTMNGCGSTGLKIFEENLRRFALNRQPAQLQSEGQESSLLTNGSFTDQNYASLLDDLISKQSQSWVINRYIPGRVSNVSVISRDVLGRPSSLKANYLFYGFGGESTGSITLTFVDGLPECLYFFDFPTTCRTPDRRIVADYARRAYQD